MNYYPDRDGQIAELDEHRTTTSEITRALLPEVRLVKTFNSIYAADVVKCARPSGAPDRSVLPLAGDDSTAKSVVAGLIDEIGYDPLDLGGLAEGFRFQNGTPAYCVRGSEEVLRPLLAEAH
ncbi:MAG: hypothetical protein LKF88_01710 [Microbacteriaceae bacterium]|jgi:predicted dinucleotide-binding enzyme|nr:hypothetical protein [Microbacteriaceae bacterium]